MISEFAKEKVFWTRKMNLKLVKFIQSRPNIWNPKHPKYTSIESRDQTYGEFAAKYGNEFTGQAVKDRWTNIRSTFANYLRKYKANHNIEGFKVNWPLWESCQFLLKVHRRSRTELKSSNLSSKLNGKTTPTSSNSEDEIGTFNSNNQCRDIADNLVTILKSSQNNAPCFENTAHDRIGRAVSNALSTMDSYHAGLVSLKIIEILNLYDRNNPSNPNNTMDIKEEKL